MRSSAMPEAASPETPRFAADAMLGRLARWLRVLGYDTTHDMTIADPALVRLADAQDRVLLTRDRRLLRDLHPRRAIELRQESPLEQLRHVVTQLALVAPDDLFTRCMLCNIALDTLPAAEAALRLPPGVRGLPGPARECPSCGRLYWHGSHVRRMRDALDRALPGWLPQGAAADTSASRPGRPSDA